MKLTAKSIDAMARMLSSGAPTTTIAVNLPDDVWAQLEVICQNHGCTLSRAITMLVVLGVDKPEDGVGRYQQ